MLGLRDFIDKNGMPSVVLGLSGGIDSALVAVARRRRARRRPRPRRRTAVEVVQRALAEPTPRTSPRALGLHYSVVPIAPMVDAYDESVELTGVAAENLQARVRGTLLMGLSNQHGHLLLTTGNKSEVAVGYSTLYGDSAGGFGADQGRARRRWSGSWPAGATSTPASAARPSRSRRTASTSRRRPSSRPGSMDSDSLPSYEELDAIIADYVDRDLGMAQLLERGHDAEMVARVLRSGGRGRVQAPAVGARERRSA